MLSISSMIVEGVLLLRLEYESSLLACWSSEISEVSRRVWRAVLWCSECKEGGNMHRSSCIQGVQNVAVTSILCCDPVKEKLCLGLVKPGTGVGCPDRLEFHWYHGHNSSHCHVSSICGLLGLLSHGGSPRQVTTVANMCEKNWFERSLTLRWDLITCTTTVIIQAWENGWEKNVGHARNVGTATRTQDQKES